MDTPVDTAQGQNKDTSATVTLKTPVVFGKTTIEELKFRRPKARDFRGLPVGMQTIGNLLDLAGLLCAQPSAVLDRMEPEDMLEVLTIVGDFIAAGLGTGLTP